MKTQRFEVLSQAEVERIHSASIEILAEVGIKVSYKTARDVYRQAGAMVDDQAESVRIPEELRLIGQLTARPCGRAPHLDQRPRVLHQAGAQTSFAAGARIARCAA